MSKVLVLGANGMLGGSLFRFFSTHSQYEVLGTVRSDSAAKAIAEQGFSNLIKDVDISNNHRISKHSFVVVNSALDPDIIPDEIMVVPTLLEAQDVIEMEEIERDLGF